MTIFLSNTIKAHATGLDQAHGQVKFGIVTSVNVNNSTARVSLQPEGVLSGWLPVMTQWIGNGWGLAAPPLPGDQVLVVPQEGDMEQGVIIGRIYSVKQTAPAAPSGEFWLVHQSGCSLKLCNDGTIRTSGDLHVAGDVYDSYGSLSALRTHYNSHTHQAPNGATSAPHPTD